MCSNVITHAGCTTDEDQRINVSSINSTRPVVTVCTHTGERTNNGAIEAIHNIIKHSRASHAQIKLKNNINSIILKIEDNGTGFDVNSKYEGIGIKNIQARAALLNAVPEIKSSKKHGGTCIFIKFVKE